MEEVADGEDNQEEDEGRRGAREEDAEDVSIPAFQFLSEDSYIGSQTEYYADHSFLNEWLLEDDFIDSSNTERFCYEDVRAEGEEGRKARSEETHIDSGELVIEKEKLSDTSLTITAEVSNATDERVNSTVRRRKRPQKRQKLQEGPQEEQRDGELRKGTEEDRGNAGEAEEQQVLSHFRRENQKRLRLAQRQKKQLEKEAERVKRQQQRLEEKKRKAERREYEREERKIAQRQDQQIRLYFAGVDTALLVAVEELLQQPQFLALRDTVVLINETARQCRQHEIRRTETLPSVAHLSSTQAETIDTVSDNLSYRMISAELLDEEFMAVEVLARLCPGSLCIVCMPHPIQNHLQLLQSQLLLTEQSFPHNMSAPPRNSENLLVQSCFSDLEGSDSLEASRERKQHSSHLHVACDRNRDTGENSSSNDETSTNPGRTRRTGAAGCGSRCIKKSRSRLSVYARFLVVPLFTETFYSGSRDSHFSASGSCSNRHCTSSRPVRTTVNTLKEKNHRSALLSLPRQLTKLQEELQGVARVVCIFQGVRASLAVPQPRVDDDTGVAGTTEELCFSTGTRADGRTGESCRSCDSSSGSHESACSGPTSICPSSSFSVAGGCAFGRFIHSQCTVSTAQKGEVRDRTEAGQGISEANMSRLRLAKHLLDSKSDIHGSTGRRIDGGKIQRFNTDEGTLAQAERVMPVEGKQVPSPGELDETIATLIIDCSIDCVEPPDATATADYLLTAAKHLRAAHKTLGEQHVRMKKSKSFTAAEEAILAEVAHAATSIIADGTRLHQPDEPAATVIPSIRDSQAAAKVTSAGAEAPSQAGPGATDVTPLVSPPIAMASSTATVERIAVSPPTGQNVQTIWNKKLDAASRTEVSCEDVFIGYEDVFSLACRLWGKQLVQIPTVTERVAAAIMRQYQRPAALLQRLRAAEADEARGRTGGPVPNEAKLAAEAKVRSLNYLSSAGKKITEAATLGGGQSGFEHLAQVPLLPVQIVKRKASEDKGGKSKSRTHRRLKQKHRVSGVERFVEELADIVLHAVPNNASQTRSLQTEEDPPRDGGCASTGAGRAAKIGLARARKICSLFSEKAPTYS